ncbi:hypothetical protein H9P43_002904 [Blastocladiella emersonii ATCC 22665]|nr:hypothetical protein H9P43_009389 [Blastocladiella emersonii ATCC 22665]KAI9152635.1 hypothetical protein H9P43_009431 [Blastocladiella emersonii ATCC 22665]KAI9183852.1 hypothetical protein H9P43_002904 [Blastocladiella emersonii ATCC 22665]
MHLLQDCIGHIAMACAGNRKSEVLLNLTFDWNRRATTTYARGIVKLTAHGTRSRTLGDLSPSPSPKLPGPHLFAIVDRLAPDRTLVDMVYFIELFAPVVQSYVQGSAAPIVDVDMFRRSYFHSLVASIERRRAAHPFVRMITEEVVRRSFTKSTAAAAAAATAASAAGARGASPYGVALDSDDDDDDA